MSNKENLNNFFVNCFYAILEAEERALEDIAGGNLTLKEIHTIEAVFKAKELGDGQNTFSVVAKILGISQGTLTTAFLNLQSKGYLTKKRASEDKRIFYIEPTKIGILANAEHAAFHEKMVSGILSSLSEDEAKKLVDSLQILTEFFNNY